MSITNAIEKNMSLLRNGKIEDDDINATKKTINLLKNNPDFQKNQPSLYKKCINELKNISEKGNVPEEAKKLIGESGLLPTSGAKETKEAKVIKDVAKALGLSEADIPENMDLINKLVVIKTNKPLFFNFIIDNLSEKANTDYLSLKDITKILATMDKSIQTKNETELMNIIKTEMVLKKADNANITIESIINDKICKIDGSKYSPSEKKVMIDKIINDLPECKNTLDTMLKKAIKDNNTELIEKINTILGKISATVENIEKNITAYNKTVDDAYKIDISSKTSTFAMFKNYVNDTIKSIPTIIVDIRSAEIQRERNSIKIDFVSATDKTGTTDPTADLKDVSDSKKQLSTLLVALKNEANKIEDAIIENTKKGNIEFNKALANKKEALKEAVRKVESKIAALQEQLKNIPATKENIKEIKAINSQIALLIATTTNSLKTLTENQNIDEPAIDAAIIALNKTATKVEEITNKSINTTIQAIEARVNKNIETVTATTGTTNVSKIGSLILDANTDTKDIVVLTNILKYLIREGLNDTNKKQIEEIKEILKPLLENISKIKNEETKNQKINEIITSLLKNIPAGSVTTKDIEVLMTMLAAMPEEMKKKVYGNKELNSFVENNAEKIATMPTTTKESAKIKGELISILPVDKLKQLIKDKPELKEKIITALLDNERFDDLKNLVSTDELQKLSKTNPSLAKYLEQNKDIVTKLK